MNHEIRICIETGKRDIAKAQETIIRAMFQRYFAADGYRGAVVMAVMQMVYVGLVLWLGIPAAKALMGLLALSLLRAALKGISLWVSSPPPGPPAQAGSTEETPPEESQP